MVTVSEAADSHVTPAVDSEVSYRSLSCTRNGSVRTNLLPCSPLTMFLAGSE